MSFIISLMLIFISAILLYIFIYTIYYFLIALASRNRRRFVRSGMYNLSNYYNNIVVIIYSHNNEREVSALLEMLNRQKYPKDNYSVYIILDNCTDNSSNKLEMIGGANIFRVGDSYTVGKDESISQLLDRLITFKNIDAYAFLGADRTVDDNFLNSINQGLAKHDVLLASTILKGQPKKLKEKIISAFNKYDNNIIKTSRSILGLSALINSDACVIKNNVIEKVQCVDFKDINTELKYSIMLSKLNYKISYDPNIVTYSELTDYTVKKPSFSYRLTLLKNSLSIILGSSFLFSELVLSIIQPSVVVLALLLTFLYWVSFMFDQYSLIINGSFLLILTLSLVGSFIFSVTKCNITIKEFFYLLLYPFYSLGGLIRKLPVIKQVCDMSDRINKKRAYEHHSIPVVVSAGDKKMNCEIDLIEEEGMIRAVFSFKNRKQATDLHLRVYDAIKSVSNMLSDREYQIVDPETKEVVEKGNFDLEICQNCKYFTSKVDGTINVIKGCCSCDNVSSEKIVMLWNSCEKYVSAKQKIVKMNEYKK